MYHRVLVSITCVIGAFSSLTAPSDLQRKTHTD